jgi:hypothetical protein
MPAYCKANGPAISTYRYRMNPVDASARCAQRHRRGAPLLLEVRAPDAASNEQTVEVLA